MTTQEKKRFLLVPMSSQEMVTYLERIGISRLEDLKGKEPKDLAEQINKNFGYEAIKGPIHEMALRNMIRAAEGTL